MYLTFFATIHPLTTTLEDAYKKVGKRWKSSLKWIDLRNLITCLSGKIHEQAFTSVQNTLLNAVKLSYPKQGHVNRVFTNALDKFWARIVTQTSNEKFQKDVSDQKHEAMAFLGGKFAAAKEIGQNLEKEAYAIFRSFERMDCLLLGEVQVNVFTSHRNLLYVFPPYVVRPQSLRYVFSQSS